MVNFLKQIQSSFSCTAAGMCNGPSPRQHTTLCKGKARCSSVPQNITPSHLYASSAAIKIPLGEQEDFRTCVSKDSHPPPTSSAMWHLRLENDRITDCVRATAGPNMNLNGRMNHFTGSESNYFL